MEEMCQLKVDKTKEKGSQHNPENVVDKEETPQVEALKIRNNAS